MYRQYLSLLWWSGAESTITEATTGLVYLSGMTMDDERGAVGGMIGRGNRSTRRKPAPVPFCSPQIPHELKRDRTRVTAVGSQRLSYDTTCHQHYNNY
jgi:hypothetical protein